MPPNVYPISFEFTLPPPPPGQAMTWAQAFALIQSTLQGSLAQDAAVLGQGSVLPTANVGPFIYTGIDPPQLYTWSVTSASYVPAALPPGTAIISPTQLYALFGGLNTSVTPNQINVNWAQLIGVPSLLGGVATAGNVGNTAQLAALTPNPYNQFFNTDINALLIYYNGTWHTVDGVPGDVKFVSAATIAVALTQNPGWVQNVAATARRIVASGDGTSQGLSIYANGQIGGAETQTLLQNQLPTVLGSNASAGLTITAQTNTSSGSVPTIGPGSVTTSGGGSTTDINYIKITNNGGGQPFNILDPFISYWCLIKQ